MVQHKHGHLIVKSKNMHTLQSIEDYRLELEGDSEQNEKDSWPTAEPALKNIEASKRVVNM